MSLTDHQARFLAEGLRNRCVFLSAAPGAGKGTAAHFLRKHIPSVHHLSTGELFRAEVAKGTPIGAQFSLYMQQGVPIPHPLVEEYLEVELGDAKYASGGILLDGFPKNAVSYDFIMEALPAVGIRPSLCIHLDVSRATCTKRLRGRLHCPNPGCGTDFHEEFKKPRHDGVCDDCSTPLQHRKDDTEDAIATRLDVFERETRPNIDKFRASGLLATVDAEQSIDSVQQQIAMALLGSVKAEYLRLIQQGMRHRCVSFVGPISSGKGTQCAALRTALNDSVAHVSEFSAEFAATKYRSGFLCDGYPLEQPALDFMLKTLPSMQMELFLFVVIDVPNSGMAAFEEKTLPMLANFTAQGGVVARVDGTASIFDVHLQVLAAVRARILAQRDGNFYLRPTLVPPREPTYHGHIDAKDTFLLAEIVNEIEAPNPNWQHKTYPISHLALCKQTKDSAYSSVYQCLPNFHPISINSNQHSDECFATSRHGSDGFDYELIRRTLETVWSDRYCKDTNGIMTELESEIFVGAFEGHIPGDKVMVETDTMSTADGKVAGFDFDKLGEAEGRMWKQRMIKNVPRWELHHAINIEKRPGDNERVMLEKLRNFCDAASNGFSLGGIFIFRKPSVWAMRTNQFVMDGTAKEAHSLLMEQAVALGNFARAEWNDREVTSGFSIEIVWAIWHVDEKLKKDTEKQY